MTYYSETLNIKAGVGSFKALPKRQKSRQKKDFFFLSIGITAMGWHWGSSSSKQALHLSSLLLCTLPLPLSLERACWGLGFLLLWLCLHLKNWCVSLAVCFVSFLCLDNYCLLNSQWNYYLAVRGTLPRKHTALATGSYNAMKSPVPFLPWDSIRSNTPRVNHWTIKHCLFLAMEM